jgi:regulation of enolase protein 1 (concanavalin A-like superfamily)
MTAPLSAPAVSFLAIPDRLRRHGAPRVWSIDAEAGVLRVSPEAATDCWQKTHYGFETDNGHFLHLEMSGDLVLSTRVRFQPVHQYDQAGLMIRVSAACWLKTSVEHEPGEPGRLGVVVTNHGYSDWSTRSLPASGPEVWLRVRREGTDYLVEVSRDGRAWEQIRMARLLGDREGAPVAAGAYACSPKGAGFVAEFTHLTIAPGCTR